MDLFEKIAELIIMTASRTLMGEIVLHPTSVNPYCHFPLQEHCMASYAGRTLRVALQAQAVQWPALVASCLMSEQPSCRACMDAVLQCSKSACTKSLACPQKQAYGKPAGPCFMCND